MREATISDYPYRRKGHRPHLTFSSLDEFEPDLLLGMERLTALYEAIGLHFRLFGSFYEKQFVLATPGFEQRINRVAPGYRCPTTASSLYTKENWIPHITIANYLNQDQHAAVQHLAQQRLDPFSGNLTELALIQITKHAVIELQVYSL